MSNLIKFVMNDNFITNKLISYSYLFYAEFVTKINVNV